MISGMRNVRIDDTQARLPDLVDLLNRDGEVLITRDEEPVARLSPPDAQPTLRRIQPASLGKVLRPLFCEDDLLEEITRG